MTRRSIFTILIGNALQVLVIDVMRMKTSKNWRTVSTLDYSCLAFVNTGYFANYKSKLKQYYF
jgi:hypothetical protein